MQIYETTKQVDNETKCQHNNIDLVYPSPRFDDYYCNDCKKGIRIFKKELKIDDKENA